MLRGSLSGFVVLAVALPDTPPELEPVVVVLLVEGVRSSTVTPVSVFGVVWQPPRSTSNAAVVQSIKVELLDLGSFIVSLRCSMLFGKRAPCGLTHIARRGGESLLHAAVAGDCGQYTTAPILGRVKDQLSVRRYGRRFVIAA